MKAIESLLPATAFMVLSVGAAAPRDAGAETFIYVQPPANGANMTVTGMNSSGDLVGTVEFGGSPGSISAYVYKRATGALTVFQDPAVNTCGGPVTTPYAINDSGTIVGSYMITCSLDGGFIRTPDGVMQNYTNPAFPNYGLVGINNRGDLLGAPMVGSSTSPPFVALASGASYVITYPTSPGSIAFVTHINDNADVSGGAYLPAQKRSIPLVFTADQTIIPYKLQFPDQTESAVSINNSRVAVASEYSFAYASPYIYVAGAESFVLNPDGTTTKVKSSRIPLPTFVAAINNVGQVVGTVWSSNSEGSPTAAFLRDANGKSTLFQLGGNTTADAINDSGEVAGTGYNSGQAIVYIRVP